MSIIQQTNVIEPNYHSSEVPSYYIIKKNAGKLDQEEIKLATALNKFLIADIINELLYNKLVENRIAAVKKIASWPANQSILDALKRSSEADNHPPLRLLSLKIYQKMMNKI
ncbi:MAG: hypothetical protein ACXAD7_12780 [Candidatus Kariarchaeaceae archaeon]|jgi:hypothetical protein